MKNDLPIIRGVFIIFSVIAGTPLFFSLSLQLALSISACKNSAQTTQVSKTNMGWPQIPGVLFRNLQLQKYIDWDLLRMLNNSI